MIIQLIFIIISPQIFESKLIKKYFPPQIKCRTYQTQIKIYSKQKKKNFNKPNLKNKNIIFLTFISTIKK